MAQYVVEGGRTLRGTVRPSGNKNEALPAIMACLVAEGDLVLRNMPRIGDVETVLDLLRAMGVAAEWQGPTQLVLNSTNLHSYRPPAELCSKVRASILLLGPLLVRMGKVHLPLPGGDVIGARRIDSHIEGLRDLGAKITFGNAIEGELAGAIGTEIYLDEPSVTATENILYVAALAHGTTVLHNAASEPHVVGLCRLLSRMGAKIEGIGTNRLTIRGVQSLHGATHDIGPDFMEVGSFLCLGAMCGGKICVEDVRLEELRFALKTLARIGIHPKIEGTTLVIDGQDDREVVRDLGGRIPVVYSGPWPAYPTDLMSVAIVAATQARGTVIFFEKMFEGRMFFTDKLMAMGAGIVLCDPHRVVVSGPTPLYATTMSSPDVRAGMALLMAALVAKGTSVIGNIYQIERGYHDVMGKLEHLGAAIMRRSD